MNDNAVNGQLILNIYSLDQHTGKTSACEYGFKPFQKVAELKLEPGWWEGFEPRQYSLLVWDGAQPQKLIHEKIKVLEDLGHKSPAKLQIRYSSKQPFTSGEPIIITSNYKPDDLYGQKAWESAMNGRCLNFRFKRGQFDGMMLTDMIREANGAEAIDWSDEPP